MFEGFTDRTFEFYMAIRFNNNREFFHDNQDWYRQAVRAPLAALCEELGDEVVKIDPEFDTRPGRCIAHVNRDIRFSRDKSPYRDYSFLKFRRVGAEQSGALGFYFGLSDECAEWGMGIYEKNLPMMRNLSQAILTRPEDVRKAIKPLGRRLTLYPNTIKRMPVPEEVPEDLKIWYPLRAFYVGRETRDFDLIKSPVLAKEIIRDYRRAKGLYKLLVGQE